MRYEILHRYTNAVLYATEAESLKEAVERAVAVEANLNGANLNGAKLPGFQIPQEGSLIVWKKLRNQTLAKLLIPAEAARTASLVGRKCRAEYAEVLLLVDAAGNEVAQATSLHDAAFRYATGQRVTPASYSNDIREECQPGIHFFLSREEAAAYN